MGINFYILANQKIWPTIPFFWSLFQNIKSKATRRAQAEATKHPWDLTHLHLSCLLGNYWSQFANKWPGLAWPPGHDSTIVSKYNHSHNVTNTISIMSMNSSQSYICRLTIMIQDLLNIIPTIQWKYIDMKAWRQLQQRCSVSWETFSSCVWWTHGPGSTISSCVKTWGNRKPWRFSITH